MLVIKIANMLRFVTPVLADNNFAITVLKEVISWCGALGAVILVIFLIKDIIGLAKGNSSLGSVLLKVLSIFIVIGIMFAAGSFQKFGQIFEKYFTETVTEDNLPQFK